MTAVSVQEHNQLPHSSIIITFLVLYCCTFTRLLKIYVYPCHIMFILKINVHTCLLRTHHVYSIVYPCLLITYSIIIMVVLIRRMLILKSN